LLHIVHLLIIFFIVLISKQVLLQIDWDILRVLLLMSCCQHFLFNRVTARGSINCILEGTLRWLLVRVLEISVLCHYLLEIFHLLL
jgi:hypothetical protein